jgi:hypothetical protein
MPDLETTGERLVITLPLKVTGEQVAFDVAGLLTKLPGPVRIGY